MFKVTQVQPWSLQHFGPIICSIGCSHSDSRHFGAIIALGNTQSHSSMLALPNHSLETFSSHSLVLLQLFPSHFLESFSNHQSLVTLVVSHKQTTSYFLVIFSSPSIIISLQSLQSCLTHKPPPPLMPPVILVLSFALRSMAWLRLLGSLKRQVSFAKEPYKRDCFLQKRTIILRSLLTVATPWSSLESRQLFSLGGHDRMGMSTYGVATISRLLKIIGLFCRLQLLLQGSFAREIYNFKEPTNRSHPIVHIFHSIEWAWGLELRVQD